MCVNYNYIGHNIRECYKNTITDLRLYINLQDSVTVYIRGTVVSTAFIEHM